jgi:hypothetical protein
MKGTSMSLEATIEKLISALDRNTAALGGKAAPAPAAAEKTAEKPAAGKPGRPPKAKALTQDDVAAKASELKEKEGMPAVRAIFRKHGAESGKIADLPEKNYGAVIEAINAALTPAEDGDDDEGEDDEGL